MFTHHRPKPSPKIFLLSWLLIIMGIVLSACAGSTSGPSTPSPGADPGAGPASGGSEGSAESGTLVVYSGRSESLIGPLIEQFEAESGIPVAVRWGNTAELAATLLEEGANSPADVFLSQDPGALGAVEPLLASLPTSILDLVDPRFSDPTGRWVGISGRARVVVYNTDRLAESDLPRDLWGFTEPQWKGRIGWAPTNASFQLMVTAMRFTWGEEEASRWLQGILANEPKVYEKNTPIVAAVGAGEVDIGFVNHYYLYRFLTEEGPSFPARNYFLSNGGPGSLVMVSGAGLLATSERPLAAQQFIRFLLSPQAQRYFAEQTKEYPLAQGIEPAADLPPLESVNAAQVDLSELGDLRGTLELLQEVGALP